MPGKVFGWPLSAARMGSDHPNAVQRKRCPWRVRMLQVIAGLLYVNYLRWSRQCFIDLCKRNFCAEKLAASRPDGTDLERKV